MNIHALGNVSSHRLLFFFVLWAAHTSGEIAATNKLIKKKHLQCIRRAHNDSTTP